MNFYIGMLIAAVAGYLVFTNLQKQGVPLWANYCACAVAGAVIGQFFRLIGFI